MQQGGCWTLATPSTTARGTMSPLAEPFEWRFLAPIPGKAAGKTLSTPNKHIQMLSTLHRMPQALVHWYAASVSTPDTHAAAIKKTPDFELAPAFHAVHQPPTHAVPAHDKLMSAVKGRQDRI
jgi:hypothetical protein